MKFYKVFSLVLIFSISLSYSFLSTLYYPAIAEEQERQIRQHEFMVHLVRAMKLEAFLPESPQVSDYIKLLESRGITLPGGYKPDELITSKQMAIMLIPAMGLDKTRFESIKKEIGLSYKDKAVIINIVGDVKVKLKETGEWKLAKPGIALGIEDIIKTGKHSSAIIRLGQISVAKVKENTTIAVYQLAKNPIIYMEEGDIILDTTGSPYAANHYIITPTTVAAVRGTIIEAIHEQDPTVKQGVTTVIVAQGKAEVYDVSEYTFKENLDMAKKDKFIVKAVEVIEGNYILKGKIYPLTKQEKESIDAEVEEVEVVAETNLQGSAAEEFLREEGIPEEDYLKIDVIEKTEKRHIAKITKR